MAWSFNQVTLIGNLTRDPELRYTPSGSAVCSFNIATNRSWTNAAGEKQEQADFHRIVAWNKLAELCSQLLYKGAKAFVQGRLTTRSFTDANNVQRTITEVIMEDMGVLSPRREGMPPYSPTPSSYSPTPGSVAAATTTTTPQGDQATGDQTSQPVAGMDDQQLKPAADDAVSDDATTDDISPMDKMAQELADTAEAAEKKPAEETPAEPAETPTDKPAEEKPADGVNDDKKSDRPF